MPIDEKLYWHVRVPRKHKQTLKKLSKRLGFSSLEVMGQAVDMWIQKYEK